MLRSTLRTVLALCATSLLASTLACSSTSSDEEADQGALHGNVASNIQRPGTVAVDSTSIYFATSMTQPGVLYKGSKSGGEPQKLADTTSDVQSIGFDDANVYWTEQSGDLFAVPKNGGSSKKLGSATKDGSAKLVLDNDSIILSDYKGIVRVPKAGGASTPVAKVWALWLAADATKLYYVRSATGMNWALFSLPKNGSYPADEKMIGQEYKEQGFSYSMDAKYIYFNTYGDDKSDRVVRIDKASGQATDMLPTEKSAGYGAVNDKALCFASHDAIGCQQVNGGSKGSVRVTKGTNIMAMALDGNFVVYAEEGKDHGWFDMSRMEVNSGAIQRVELPRL